MQGNQASKQAADSLTQVSIHSPFSPHRADEEAINTTAAKKPAQKRRIVWRRDGSILAISARSSSERRARVVGRPGLFGRIFMGRLRVEVRLLSGGEIISHGELRGVNIETSSRKGNTASFSVSKLVAKVVLLASWTGHTRCYFDET